MTSILARAKAAWYAFVRYDEANQIPMPDGVFDSYTARLSRYALYDAMYNNTVYSGISAFAALLKAKHRLYKNIRGIYNPVSELIDVTASAVYGGLLDTETFQRGAIPIQTDNPAVLPAIAQLWEWSRWAEKKLEYVRLGANLGDVAIKIVDDRERGKVRMEILHPAKIRDVTLDEVGNVKRVVIQYERSDEDEVRVVNGRIVENPNPKTYTYTEIIDGDWFEFYKNGYSHAYFQNSLGEAVSRFPNEYGFVPLVIARYQEIADMRFGGNAYWTALPQIHEINDQASLLNDQIRKVVIPLLYGAGITSADQIQKSTVSERDNFTILYGPRDSSLNPIVPDIDIAAAAANIQDLLKGIERKLPELAAWKRIREEAREHTAPGVRAVATDAIWRISAAMGQFDPALVRAQKMGLSIGGKGKYRGFEWIRESSYDNGELDHQIAERAIIPDTLSLKEEVDALHQGGAPLWLIMEKLGYSQETISRVTAEQEARARADLRQALGTIFGDEDEEDEPEGEEEPDAQIA